VLSKHCLKQRIEILNEDRNLSYAKIFYFIASESEIFYFIAVLICNFLNDNLFVLQAYNTCNSTHQFAYQYQPLALPAEGGEISPHPPATACFIINALPNIV